MVSRYAGPATSELCRVIQGIASAAKAASESQLPCLIAGRLAAACSAHLQPGQAEAQLQQLLPLMLSVGAQLESSTDVQPPSPDTVATESPPQSAAPAKVGGTPDGEQPQLDSGEVAAASPSQPQPPAGASPAQQALSVPSDAVPSEGDVALQHHPAELVQDEQTTVLVADEAAAAGDQHAEPVEDHAAQPDSGQESEQEVPAQPSWGSGIGTAPDNPFRGSTDQAARPAAASAAGSEGAHKDDWGDDFEEASAAVPDDQPAAAQVGQVQPSSQAASIHSACLQVGGPSRKWLGSKPCLGPCLLSPLLHGRLRARVAYKPWRASESPAVQLMRHRET